EDGIRDLIVTGVQTCALPILLADRIVVAEGPDEIQPLADALSLDPPYRAEAVRREEGVWAVAGRRIEVTELPDVEGDELELSSRSEERRVGEECRTRMRR